MQHLAIVFPGQGSQKVGMLNQLSERYSFIQTLFSQASHVLGYDLWNIVANGPSEQLNTTIYTQPAMLVADISMWKVLHELQPEIKPCFLAGHSLGEFSALVAAKAISFEQAVLLVAKRAQYMQEAVKPGEGAMAAIIGLTDEQVKQLCASVMPEDAVAPANYNSPGQVVIAGNANAVQSAMVLAKEQGGKAILLPVSVPSHSPLMQKAAVKFAKELDAVDFVVPTIPVLHNVDVTTSHTVDEIKLKLVAQLFSPVRWTDTILYLKNQGIKEVIECGPGNVLSNLIKRIDNEMKVINPFNS